MHYSITPVSATTTIIVGAGVIGLSTAYHLAQRGAGKVIVLEKEHVGDGASSRAAGIINGLMWSETGVEARKIALTRFRELSEELDGYRFQDVGCLSIFDEPAWHNQAALLPIYDRLHADYEVLDAGQMRQRWPLLTPPDNLTGLFDPQGGYSEPDHYVPALASQARALGVEIREQVAVTGFLERAGRCTGVATLTGDVEADCVVCATHVWSLRLLQQCDCHVPLKIFVHQRFVTHPLTQPVHLPAINAIPLGGYVRPALGNCLLVGLETHEREDHPAPAQNFRMSTLQVPPQLHERARGNLVPILPCLERQPWNTEHVGLLCFSMDGEPILGPAPALSGLYIGTAFHSGGFAYNPAAGVLLADFVETGQARMDVSLFSPDRFKQPDVASFVAQTMTQDEYYNQILFRRRH